MTIGYAARAMPIRAQPVPPEEVALIALRRIVRFLRIADREVEAACHISAAQLFVLHSLVGRPAASLSELAQRTLTDQSSVSTVIARLVDRKLVRRTPSRQDRRRAELEITAAGIHMVEKAPRVPQAQMIAAIRALPAKRRNELARVLDGLATTIGAKDVAPRMLFDDEPRGPRRSSP
jgi:DNA-binding MarR family transcriptional regulator